MKWLPFVLYLQIVNGVYAQELLNTKEMRYIKVTSCSVFLSCSRVRSPSSPCQVDIKADQVDFRLSTPRTTWNAGDGLGVCPTDSAPPATMSLMGISLRVVDPLVPASYDFDRVRSAPTSL
jgi:hypothetical protein